ncbi:MAG: glycosyltransferase [Desulfomonilia bacterium]|nr:glycosyltransferase [Desulfomonilia bacterium]
MLHIRDSGGMFGGERVILTLGRNMDREVFACSLMCMDRGDGRCGPLMAAAERSGISVSSMRVRGRIDLPAIRFLSGFIREHKIDLIHTHDFKSDFYGVLATQGMRVKRVATAHGSTRDSFVKRLYLLFNENLVYPRFDMVIAVSEDLRPRLEGRRLQPEKIRVIQNGLDIGLLDVCGRDHEPRLPRPGNRDRRVFAVIGRLYPDKGHTFFLHAFETLAHEFPDITGLIIGDGPERERIQSSIRALGIEERVFCCGVRKNMRLVYDSIDYLVIPSLTEGLPYVMLEAMACGIPVLAAAVGDIPLLVSDGLTGYLVNPGDATGLTRRMRDLIVMPEAAQAMAQEGGRLVNERFSATSMVGKTQELYLSLIGR